MTVDDPNDDEHNYKDGYWRCGRTDDRCGQKAGWGTDHVGVGACKLHGGNNSGENGQGAPEGNTNAADTGAWAKSFLTDFLRDDEIERVMNASDIIGEPEGAQDLAQKVAVVCLEQFRRTGDQRFLQRYESICDKANLFPDDDAADVNISLDDLYE